MKLLLIDGDSLAHRCYYSNINKDKILTNQDGCPIAICSGFITDLYSLFTRLNPSHLAIAFNSPVKSFRYQVCPEYKQNRDENKPEDFVIDLRNLRLLLSQMQICNLNIPGFEVGDLLATIASKTSCSVVIHSNDKKILQLVSDRVSVHYSHSKTHQIYNPDLVKKEFGFAPELIPLFKAIAGNPSDNIKGVAGIGKITAAQLIQKYGNLANILANSSALKPRMQTKLQDNQQLIEKLLKITTFNNNVPLKLSLDSCQINQIKNNTSIGQELEIQHLINQINH
ncbi:MAG: 5'-3' exonuclease H3TH domain-containing protein [Xenococcus sp. (in: cyanobacteria)]